MSENAQQAAPAPLGGRAIGWALAVFWSAFVSLNTLRGVILDYPHPGSAFLRRIAIASIGVGLSWLLCQALDQVRRRASDRATWAAIVALSLPAAALFSSANLAVFDYLAPVPGETCHNGLIHCTPHDAFVELSDLTVNWSFVFAAWGLLYVTLTSSVRLRDAERQADAYREVSRLAEIRALRYQINPHFLFNVLNSLTALVRRRDSQEAERLIGEIGGFLRFSLSVDPVADIPLLDEIDMQLRYLEIERWRFPDRIMIEVDIAPAAEATMVPALLLQPIVENAVKHGVGRTSAPVRITISADLDGERRLRLQVVDNAPPSRGRGGADPAPVGFGIGLKNVRERLLARFGPTAHCRAEVLPQGGFRVELILPVAPSAR